MRAPANEFPRYIPFGLSVIAGFVDAVIFLALFGLYVAQATGSFVIIGAHWLRPEPGFLVKVLAIPAFLIGGVVATLIVEASRSSRRAALLRTLALEEILLLALFAAGASGFAAGDPDAPGVAVAALCGLFAMGLQSASVRLLMPGYGSTNVMTTNTTLVAIDLTHVALALASRRGEGRAALGAAAARLANSLSVVGGFLAGTLIGALAYHLAGLWALAVPLLLIDAVAAWVWFRLPRETMSGA